MQENLPEEDMPPAWMHEFDEEMEKWFKVVEKRRKGDPEIGEDEDGEEYEENAFAQGMRDL